MSAQLTKARSLLNQVGSHLKRKNLVSAVNGLYEGLNIITKNPLIRSERDEFHQLMEQAVYLLSIDPQIKGRFPILDEYKPGQEKELISALREILNDLTADSTDAVRDMMADREKKKKDILEKGQAYLDRGEKELALSTFNRLVKEFPSDADLFGEVADRLIRAECYAEALEFLREAIDNEPKSPALYNRIGMVLRRLRDYPSAEEYYARAVKVCDTDEYLYFNFGRLYVDWKKWEKVKEMSEKALALNPGFEEAKKMLAFAEKKVRLES